MRNGYIFAAIFAATALFSSCQRFTLDGSVGSSIGIKVSSRSGATKAGGEYGVYNRTIVGSNCLLDEYVSDYPVDGPSTKGAIITSSTINASGKTFKMEGWLGEELITAENAGAEDLTNRHFLSETVTCNGSTWSMGSTNYWRNDIPTTFWSYVNPAEGPAPVFTWPGDNPVNTALKSISFTYSLPAPGGDGNDAFNLQDFLVAYNRESRKRSDSSTSMNVKFSHPLAAVKFIVDDASLNGNPDPANDEYVRILRVEISGVKSSATFTATGESGSACTFSCSNYGESASYAQGIATGSDMRQDIENGLFTAANSQYVFFMIPQSLDGAKVKVVFQKRSINTNFDGSFNSFGDWKTIEQTASLAGDSWVSGKYYTYKISANVYAGGETIALPTNPEDIEHSSNVEIDENGVISFNWAGSVDASGYVAPIPVKQVKIIKMSWEQSYVNSSGKGIRKIWLQDKDNPSLTTMSLVSGENYKTIVTNWKDYWPDGYTGQYIFDKKGKAAETMHSETAYFLLNGEFSSIQIYFSYYGTTGSGSSDWTVKAPFFNVSEVIELVPNAE